LGLAAISTTLFMVFLMDLPAWHSLSPGHKHSCRVAAWHWGGVCGALGAIGYILGHWLH